MTAGMWEAIQSAVSLARRGRVLCSVALAVVAVVRLVLLTRAVAVRAVRVEPPLPLLELDPGPVPLPPHLLRGQSVGVPLGILALDATALPLGPGVDRGPVPLRRGGDLTSSRRFFAGRAPPGASDPAFDGTGAVGTDAGVQPLAGKAPDGDTSITTDLVEQVRPAAAGTEATRAGRGPRSSVLELRHPPIARPSGVAVSPLQRRHRAFGPFAAFLTGRPFGAGFSGGLTSSTIFPTSTPNAFPSAGHSVAQ